MKDKKMLGNFILLLTALIWGTAFVFQRVGMESIEPITFNAMRMLIAAVAIGILYFVLSKKNKLSPDIDLKERKKNTLIGGIICGVVLTAASIFQQYGLVYTTAGKAGFITAMYILLVPVISFVFLKKKITYLVWIAVLAGLVGMYLLCVNENFSFSLGDLLVFICAIFFSIHILCCDHFVKKSDAIGIAAVQFATSTVLSFMLSFIFETPSVEKVSSALIPIIYCGLISGGIGYTLQIVGQKFSEPATASLLMSMESVFAVITGVLVLNESMSVKEIIGCIIMFAAVLLVQIPIKKKNKKPQVL